LAQAEACGYRILDRMMKTDKANDMAGDGGLRAEGEKRTLGVPRIREDRSSPYPAAFGVNLWNSSPASFTLVEMLVVLVIIVILAALTVGAAKYALTRAAAARAQSEIAAMENALEHYKSDNGRYPASTLTRNSFSPGFPTATEIGNSVNLYAALSGKYFTFKSDQTRVDPISGNRYVIDPFGNPYNYYCPPPPTAGLVWSNQATFDLWSYGPDGRNDTADDIVNWRQ
jgi:general secretion pathway protein G